MVKRTLRNKLFAFYAVHINEHVANSDGKIMYWWNQIRRSTIR